MGQRFHAAAAAVVAIIVIVLAVGSGASQHARGSSRPPQYGVFAIDDTRSDGIMFPHFSKPVIWDMGLAAQLHGYTLELMRPEMRQYYKRYPQARLHDHVRVFRHGARRFRVLAVFLGTLRPGASRAALAYWWNVHIRANHFYFNYLPVE